MGIQRAPGDQGCQFAGNITTIGAQGGVQHAPGGQDGPFPHSNNFASIGIQGAPGGQGNPFGHNNNNITSIGIQVHQLVNLQAIIKTLQQLVYKVLRVLQLVTV